MAVRGSIEVGVPARVAYERLCRVEEYPRFHRGVRRVTAVSETDLRWECDNGAFTARVTDRQPDHFLRWRALDGPRRSETVVVQALPSGRCRITVETTGPRPDLALLKEYVEAGAGPRRPHGNERPVRAARSNWPDARLPHHEHVANERPAVAADRNPGPPPADTDLWHRPHNALFKDET